MPSSLLALLSHQAPLLETRKALIITGLQHDFLSPDGKLPIDTSSGFVNNLQTLVPAFREFGYVIWVRSEFQSNRDVNSTDETGDSVVLGPVADDPHQHDEDVERDSPGPFKKVKVSLEENKPTGTTETTAEDEPQTEPDPARTRLEDDEELFLSRTPHREPCCLPGTLGAEYATQIKDLIDESKDLQFVKSYYSAIRSTPLLLTLRSKLITEIYICGCMTNISVFATAVDVARHGIQVTLIEDCLGYRRKDRHDSAMKQLHEIMEPDVMNSVDVINALRNPVSPPEQDEEYEDDEIAVGEDADGIPAMMQMNLGQEVEEVNRPTQDQLLSAPLPLNLQNLQAHDLQTQATLRSLLADAAANQGSVPEMEQERTLSSLGSSLAAPVTTS